MHCKQAKEVNLYMSIYQKSGVLHVFAIHLFACVLPVPDCNYSLSKPPWNGSLNCVFQ